MIEQLTRLPIEILRRMARQFTGGKPVRQTLRAMLGGDVAETEEAFDPRPPVAEEPFDPRPPAQVEQPKEPEPEPAVQVAEPEAQPLQQPVPARPLIDVTPLPTPNPNAMKFVCNVAVVENGSMSFTSADAARGHALGEALFAIDGVRIVFGVNDFVSVTKNNDASWFDLIPAVERALKDNVGAAVA